MKENKNILTSISDFFSKYVVMPISKFVLFIYEKIKNPSKKFENMLSKSNTLLFISLIIAVIIFVTVDQKIESFKDSSAELVEGLNVKVLYDEDNYVVEGIPDSVDLTMIGSKANLYLAKQSPTQEVTIDLWGLKAGTHKVDIKYNQVSNSIKYNVNPSVATVIIREKISATKTLTVDLLNQDVLNETYVVGDLKLSSDTAVIKGANYKVNQVATVKALVDINNLPKFTLGQAITVSSTLKAYDEKGNVVDVEISPAKVDVDLTVTSPSKQVPIQVIPDGKVVYNMGISNLTINDNSNMMVTIYGSSEALSAVDYIPVRINVEGLSESSEFKVELTKPVDIKSMSVNSVTVRVELSNDISNSEINNVGISAENLGSGYGVTPIDIDTITVKVKGVTSVIEGIDETDINAYVDLKGLGEGVHDVDIYVTGNDNRVEYTPSVLKMKVRIYKK